ncbi:phosphate signaling complex protein PhoU [Fulvivirgaceae bacterium BMA10]|uniref:Phosphate-specific transport system accessory protein PhoU n=1 Tax=Splendidivirga corallicola TaxID=3051826 RepID=A0ABT8KTL6_9BACT|nr:phosphate signaling complex protein PhoU [Fulvivirgaceae bacterium BMA10]
MTNLEQEIEILKANLLDMTSLVISQLIKCKEATINSDVELAAEIVSNDKRVNAMELKIDKDCENMLALYSPVATDLRFVLATLKINHDLERIGDNAESMAELVTTRVEESNKKFLDKYLIDEMFDTAISMLDDVYEAIENEDTKLARQIVKKDRFLNECNLKAPSVAVQLIKDNPDDAEMILALFSIVRKLERVGDLTKNLGEEVIFHIEAKVMKHRKEQKKMKKEGKLDL